MKSLKKLDATIAGQFTPDQLTYMEKTGISPERFARVAAMGKAWLQSVAADMGRKGGCAKVAKGFSTMSPERRTEIAKAAAKKRWTK